MCKNNEWRPTKKKDNSDLSTLMEDLSARGIHFTKIDVDGNGSVMIRIDEWLNFDKDGKRIIPD